MNLRLTRRWTSSIVALLILAMLIVARPTRAASTFYVAPTGNDANPGTQTQPFATLAKAAAVVNPGDTVYIRGGTYNFSQPQRIERSGTSTAWITFKAYPGDPRPIFDCTNIGSGAGCVTVGSQYISVEGLEIRNSAWIGFFLVGAKHVKVLNNIIHDSYNAGISASYGSVGVNEDYLIEGNQVYRNVKSNMSRPDYGSGWAAGVGIGRSKNVTLRNNYIHHNWGEGITNYLVDGARVVGNRLHDNFSVQLYFDNAINSTYERNLVYTTNDPNHYRLGGPATSVQLGNERYESSMPLNNNKLLNNILIGGRFSLFYSSADGNGGIKNTVIANNTIYGGSYSQQNTQQMVYFGPDSGHSGNRIFNNIFFDTGARYGFIDVPANGFSFSNNLWYSSAGNTLGADRFKGAGDVLYQNPQLANPVGTTAGDYKLKSTSPAINKGTASGAPTVDYFGAARPQSGGYDLGAHEFGGTVTPSPSPSASPSPSPSGSPSPSPSPSGSCQVVYSKYSDWGSGFSVNLTIKNTGTTPITGWTLGWTFSGNQTISSAWNSYATQSGQSVSLRNGDWNGSIAPGASVTDAGFNGTYSGSNPNPTVFYLNGVRCS